MEKKLERIEHFLTRHARALDRIFKVFCVMAAGLLFVRMTEIAVDRAERAGDGAQRLVYDLLTVPGGSDVVMAFTMLGVAIGMFSAAVCMILFYLFDGKGRAAANGKAG